MSDGRATSNRVCPKCGGSDVADSGKRTSGSDGAIIVSLAEWHCQACGWIWYEPTVVNAGE